MQGLSSLELCSCALDAREVLSGMVALEPFVLEAKHCGDGRGSTLPGDVQISCRDADARKPVMTSEWPKGAPATGIPPVLSVPPLLWDASGTVLLFEGSVGLLR